MPTVAHGRGDKNVVPYLQRVNYTCDAGYSINGSEEATCNENGTLTELKPVCNSELSHFLGTNTDFSKICIPHVESEQKTNYGNRQVGGTTFITNGTRDQDERNDSMVIIEEGDY